MSPLGRPPHLPLRGDLSPKGEVGASRSTGTLITSPWGEGSDCGSSPGEGALGLPNV